MVCHAPLAQTRPSEALLESSGVSGSAPSLSLAAVAGIALPLFVVTMASQNVPGIAVARASGYALPVSPVIGWIGVVNAVLAPFGAYALNLAAITAAICMGREAHEDPARRYVAAIAAGVFYIVVGVFGATVAALFAAFPKELIVAIAGLALLGTIGNSLASARAMRANAKPHSSRSWSPPRACLWPASAPRSGGWWRA